MATLGVLGMTLVVTGLTVGLLPREMHASSTVEIPVEHAFGDGKFVSAGVLLGELSNKGGIMGPLKFMRDNLSKKQVETLRKLVIEDGNYQIRIRSNPLKTGDSAYVMASLRARCLAVSGFKESLWLDLTEDNRIVGLDYRPANGRCDPLDPMESNVDGHLEFQDERLVLYWYPRREPWISMDDYLAKLDDETETSGEDGKPGQIKKSKKKKGKEKTWLQQNWMFVLGGAIIFMQLLGTLNTPQEPGQEGGVPQGAAASGRGRRR